MSFRHRLVWFLVVTLVAVQLFTAAFAYFYLRQSLVERGKQELIAAMTVFTRQLDFLSERVTDGVQVLSLDYALRAAIAQHDHDTELSALRNHGQRIGATRMMLIGLDGAVAADTAAPRNAGHRFPFASLLEQAAASDKGTALATLGNRIYWIVVVPVRAPVPIAFIAACIPVDRVLLEKLRAISDEPHAIVLAARGPNGRWHAVAGSTSHLRHVALPATANPPATTAVVTAEDGADFLTVSARLSAAKGSAPILAILDYPLAEAFAAYRSVITPLLIVLAIALLAALAGAMLVVRGATQPLETLAAAARRIAAGDYTPPPRLAQRDELGHLADALVNMTHSIAERESALRNAVEAMEIARNEAVHANEAKSQFLANMSHELRTPLNAIVGFSEMLREEVLGPLGVARYRDYAGDIHASGGHLLELVERMLDLAEAEAKRLSLARKQILPAQLLQECVTGLRPFAERSGVELALALDPAHSPQIDGDAAKLRQAFTNLIHNAIKFTPARGGVSVTTQVQSDGLSIRIADSGVGMEPDLLAAVVRPFHRLRSALDGQHQGAGLGLPLAKVIVELHGGTLSLQSKIGVGTVVSILLPVEAMSRAAA
jgi:signal transduction histidine kinase